MDPRHTGALIRARRLERGLTQRTLAEKLNVTDRAVSKWERGAGLPDVGTLNALARALGARVEDLLEGSLPENEQAGGNMKKASFYFCPACGNFVMSAAPASVACCGRTLDPLTPQKPDPAHAVQIEIVDGERYARIDHPMDKDHYVNFIALLTANSVVLVRQYPEWPAEMRFPLRGRGRLLWNCVKHGLFQAEI
jgi:DNA-binding XRE family transcriptional regulator